MLVDLPLEATEFKSLFGPMRLPFVPQTVAGLDATDQHRRSGRNR
jgi:hypothetical protein